MISAGLQCTNIFLVMDCNDIHSKKFSTSTYAIPSCNKIATVFLCLDGGECIRAYHVHKSSLPICSFDSDRGERSMGLKQCATKGPGRYIPMVDYQIHLPSSHLAFVQRNMSFRKSIKFQGTE